MTKPVLLITRRVPAAVEARATRDYDARLNSEDVPRSGADIVRLAQGAAAILCCPAEQVDAGTIAKLPDSVRVIATFSVGYDHVAVEAAAAPRHCGLQHAGGTVGRDGRDRHAARLGSGKTCRRRRAAGALRQLAGLGTDTTDGHAGLGQAPGDRPGFPGWL